MAESDFSWKKLAIFFGVGLLAFLCCVVIAGGIYLIRDGRAFNGVFVIVSGILCGTAAVLLYRNYQKNSRKDLPGVKIEDLEKKK
jgi:hypothetical protein